MWKINETWQTFLWVDWNWAIFNSGTMDTLGRIFWKGENFLDSLFVSMYAKSLLKVKLLQWEGICSVQNKFFPFKKESCWQWRQKYFEGVTPLASLLNPCKHCSFYWVSCNDVEHFYAVLSFLPCWANIHCKDDWNELSQMLYMYLHDIK